MNENTLSALNEVIEDEYKARATYRRVIETFGSVRPFSNIVESEERHISALLSLFSRYGLEPPDDTWEAKVETPASIADACAAGVRAEIDNAEMYGRLLAVVEEPDIKRVFQNLQSASQENHLPAFRRCVARTSESGA